MNLLFKLGIFFLPFENLVFAPSAGWATITPVIFALYGIFNLNKMFLCIKKYKMIFLFFSLSMLISIFNYFIYGINLINMINSLISLFMGFATFIAFDIYFVQKKKKMNKILKIIIIAYSISLVIGIIQYFAIKFNLNTIIRMFDMLSKRKGYLLYGRTTFTFTEPSFIGMHLYGVLYLFYIFTKDKRIFRLIVIYIIVTLFIGSSVRFFMDTGVFLFLILMKKINLKKIYSWILIIMIPIITIISFNYLYNSNYRVRQIINDGVYADGSLAARYFRINAALQGYIKQPVSVVFGYGIGNSIVPHKLGYNTALDAAGGYTNREIKGIGSSNYNDDSVSYCLYTRIINEYGLIFSIIMILWFFKRYKKSKFSSICDLFIVFYLYIQFESLAFYTIWILIVFESLKKQNIEVLES